MHRIFENFRSDICLTDKFKCGLFYTAWETCRLAYSHSLDVAYRRQWGDVTTSAVYVCMYVVGRPTAVIERRADSYGNAWHVMSAVTLSNRRSQIWLPGYQISVAQWCTTDYVGRISKCTKNYRGRPRDSAITHAWNIMFYNMFFFWFLIYALRQKRRRIWIKLRGLTL